MLTRTTTKWWFELPEGTEVHVVGEANGGWPGWPNTRTIIIRRADGEKIVGPDGPKTEVGVAETFLNEPVPRMARNIDHMELGDLE